MHLGRELQTRQCLAHVSLQRADHDEHEGLGVAAQGELEEISQLERVSGGSIHTVGVGDNKPCCCGTGCVRRLCPVPGLQSHRPGC